MEKVVAEIDTLKDFYIHIMNSSSSGSKSKPAMMDSAPLSGSYSYTLQDGQKKNVDHKLSH